MAEEEGLNDQGRIALGRRLIANTLLYSSARPSATSILRGMKHDADLLPAIQRRLQVVLDGFHRDSNVVYDIQGRNDLGCDLLIRLSTGREVQFIGLQVKSHVELLKEEVVTLLIRQHFDAHNHYSPMLVFYIVLAADLSVPGEQHRVVRAVQQRFSTTKSVVVVSPQYTASFLRLEGSAIDALITQTMRAGDPLTIAGQADLRRHPIDAAILLRLIERSLAGSPFMTREEIASDVWIQAVAEGTPIAHFRDTPFRRPRDGVFYRESEYRRSLGLQASDDDTDLDEFNDIDLEPANSGDANYWAFFDYDLDGISLGLRRHFLSPTEGATAESAARLSAYIADTLDRFEDDLILADDEGDRFAIKLEEHLALVAIAAEGTVKHELVGNDLVQYVIALLLPAD